MTFRKKKFKSNPLMEQESLEIQNSKKIRHLGASDEIDFWCEKYNLTYEEYDCKKCENGKIKMNVLWHKKTYYGLESSPCEICGSTDLSKSHYVNTDEKMKKVIKKLMSFAS